MNLMKLLSLSTLLASSTFAQQESDVKCIGSIGKGNAKEEIIIEIKFTPKKDIANINGGITFEGTSKTAIRSSLTFTLSSDTGEEYVIELNRCGQGSLWNENKNISSVVCYGPYISEIIKQQGADCGGE